MNAEKIAFRDRFRAKEVELADNLINLALHGKTEQIRLAATERCIDRGWGRPPQPHDGDGQVGPMTLMVVTDVPEPDYSTLPDMKLIILRSTSAQRKPRSSDSKGISSTCRIIHLTSE
jgi:hypothetical protein